MNFTVARVECMRLVNFLIILVLSEVRNKELERKVNGFENLVKVLSMEVDRQREEIELLKRQKRFQGFNPLRRVA
jgi:hypothetical protein